MESRIEEMLTIGEIARILKVSKGSVYTRIYRGSFPIRYVKLGKLIRFPQGELDRFQKDFVRTEAEEGSE